jgi:hypothetical protein
MGVPGAHSAGTLFASNNGLFKLVGSKRYNSHKRNIQRKLNPMKLCWLAAVVASGLTGLAANATPSQWEQPAAALAAQIAEILGPGQARLTIRNLSTVSTGEIPAIREVLEKDLKTHGVLASGAESANSIRVTLSENLRERLWVAEVSEGNETRVAMCMLSQALPGRRRSGKGSRCRNRPCLPPATR